MLEVGVFHQIIECRILVEPLGVLLGPESVVEPPGVIRGELGWHVSRSSRIADRRDRSQATGSGLRAISTLSVICRESGSQQAVSRGSGSADTIRHSQAP